MMPALFVGASLLLAVAAAADTQLAGSRTNVMTEWVQAFSQRDSKGIAALYAEDATLFPANESAVKGRAEIEGWYRKLFATGSSTLKRESERSLQEGAMAFETGEFELAIRGCNANDVRTETRRYIWTLRRSGSGDRWIIDSHMFNAAGPPVTCK